MDNGRMPFLTPETMRAQRVEVYLEDLKARLKVLRAQHDEVIQNSVDIISEIDQVSSSLLLRTTKLLVMDQPPSISDKTPSIKQLIQEFETIKEPARSSSVAIAIDSKVNIRRILQNFEELNQCHVLKDSLVLFKRAKESLKTIDTILDTQSKTIANSTILDTQQSNIINSTILDTQQNNIINSTIFDTQPQNIAANSALLETQANDIVNSQHYVYAESTLCAPSAQPDIMPPPEMLNARAAATTGGRESPSHYASCCSSVMSIDTFHSTVELGNLEKSAPSTTNSLETGYDGDNDDSEYDFSTIKQKKQKSK